MSSSSSRHASHRPAVLVKRSRAIVLAALALGAALGTWAQAASPAHAAPGAGGTQEISLDLRSGAMRAYTYRPACANPSLLVVLHGQQRNARDYLEYAKELADSRCLLAVAPEFDKAHFPSWKYQHGGVVHGGRTLPKDKWTGQVLLEFIEKMRASEGRSDMPYYLIGHSAGGQFLSRFAALHPSQAQRIVVANPSSHMWPDLGVQAPYGFGGIPHGARALRRYLEAPVTIYLGKEDHGSKSLDERPPAMAQGQDRYERGIKAFRAAREHARAQGWTFNWRLVEREGVAHQGRKMLSPQAWQALAP